MADAPWPPGGREPCSIWLRPPSALRCARQQCGFATLAKIADNSSPLTRPGFSLNVDRPPQGRVEDGQQRSVSHPRSSNRTCGFPASSSRTGLHREARPKPVDARTSRASATGSIDNSPCGFFLH